MQNSVTPPRVSAKGSEAPLDLIIGHLTDNRYIPVVRPVPDSDTPKNWYKPESGIDHNKTFHYVAKLQPFSVGGYEVTLSKIDLQKVASAMDNPRKGGRREKGEQKDDDVLSSVQRSKRRIRHLIKSMGCDRLLTLTVRESNKDEFRTVEWWANAWDRFNRLCKKAGFPIQYVAVLERHKKGNYHLHAAIVGRCNVNIMRRCWLAVIGKGKGAGNIDVKMKQGVTEYRRRAGLAKYVGKYISKQIGQTEFNKKRYWSSRHRLPSVRRYILAANEIQGALLELAEYLKLSPVALSVNAFQTDTVIWFSYDEDLAAPPPF